MGNPLLFSTILGLTGLHIPHHGANLIYPLITGMTYIRDTHRVLTSGVDNFLAVLPPLGPDLVSSHSMWATVEFLPASLSVHLASPDFTFHTTMLPERNTCNLRLPKIKINYGLYHPKDGDQDLRSLPISAENIVQGFTITRSVRLSYT